MARIGQVGPSFMGGCVMVVGLSLLLQSFLLGEVTGIEHKDEKAYYSPPDPRARSPPSGSRGRGSPPRVTPPTPARSCGSPPRGRDPSRSTPTPTPPSRGGYYRSPPASRRTPSTPVTTPVDPRTPSTPTTNPPPSGGYYAPPTPTYGGGSPPTPVFSTPPATPIDPGTPGIPSITAPPFGFGPNPFFRPYTYWLSNPGMVFGLFGFVVPMGTAFRVTTPIPNFPAALNLIQALGNTSADGLGALYREGTAALLNSIASNQFPFTPAQVRQNFIPALRSNKAASAQARLFKLANEGRLKPRAN
ncbi:hypothetical protein BT93_J0950 [Corymbia citriodora subsp. variegata]|nr:hypothetical protein BT93_J0950 [Corymbia citriodora subsp. variegata]